MRKKLSNLKKKRVLISAILVVLFGLMIGLIYLLNPRVNNIKISKVLSNTKTLSASVIDGVSEGVTSNNYDEIKYQIKVEKENDNDEAVISGTLTDNENKYARFKDVKDAVVTNNGKTITITTTRKNITVTVIVENAPYGVTINPTFTINSLDENNSKIDVEPVTITGKSVEGIIKDENGTLYNGVELSLVKNGTEVKRTYTKDDGKYVFSLGSIDNYEVRLVESKYKIVRYEEETTDSNRRVLNIVIKEVEPFTLNMKKTITKLDLVINGKKETFNYNDETKVLRSIKNAKTIEGSIYYNIYLKNVGEVKGTVTALKDVIPEGMSFDESKNPGWTKEDNNLFYTPLEGTELDAFEKTSVTLVLDIVKTDEAKTYINTAIAHGDDYKYVVYYLNNNIYKELYVINSDKIDNIDPHVENFVGWYTDRNYTNKYNFNNPVTKDTALYGKIDNKKYNVTFIDKNPNSNQETILTIVEVKEGNPVDLVNYPEYNGYTFKCFELYNSCYNDEPITGDIELYTSYEVNNYEIEYNLDGGTVAVSNPTSYTVRDEITLNNPTKEGYTFIGWTGTGLSEETMTVTIPAGSTGKRTYTAHYQINRSTLTINPNGGKYDNNTSIQYFTEDYGTVKTISNSERTGYTFKRYDHANGGIYSDGSYTFDNDDGTLTAVYEIITYRITYDNITDDERAFLTNPTEYDIETNTFTLKNPNTRVDGQGNNYQDFLGWDDGNGNVSLTVTIPKGSVGDRNYTAVWRENGDEYGITYNLNGGAYETGKTNPSTYTRQTATFTLNNPSKNGYTFLGWTGTDLTGNTVTVTIPKGSAGDRAYTANYGVIPYEIHYHGLTTEEETALRNPTGYNIESASITLNNPTRTGYEFIGWSGTDIDDKSTSVLIPTGSTGDRDYTANFVPIEYSLTYTLNGGDYETGKTNPPKYTIESEDITLNNPSKNGYTFKGWSGTDLTGNENITVTIPSGSIGHRSFLANYTPITYTITYDYDGGALPTGVINIDRYTIESDEITFNAPEKEGYTFLHYKEGNNIITSIPTGSTGNKELKAYYQINKFNVVFHNENEVYATNEVDWNTTTTAPVDNPTKAHGIFLYWSEDGVTPFDFDNTYITVNKDLYAVYEMVIEPVITYTPTLDETTNRTWVCSDSNNNDCGDTVTITSGKDDPEYTLYYKIGDGDAVEYTGPFKVYENTTITAFAKKNGIYSPNTTEDIVNVDSIAPTINNPGTGAMSFNMTVSGTAQDAGSGVKKFTLYVKEKDALVYDDSLTYESEIFDGIKDHAENYDHTFYGVQENTEYTIKIVAEDYVGNISEKEVEVKTHPYVARVVGKNGILWYTVDPDTKEFVIEDGKEFLLFDSIQAAVDYCADVQCTIQTNPIFPVVNESVTIANNQSITIDLDGRGITSDANATFINNGKLQIVDRNPRMNCNEHESIGFVKNTTDKAIVNNDKFILGDGSSEPSETFIFPELDRPIIEGVNNALEQNNLFYFYDGKLISDGTVILDRGEDAITQYSYNAILTGENDKNIATLDKVTDPEARIRSTYYAKLKNTGGLNAFDSSRTGEVTTEEAKFLSKIKQAGDYGFIYDAVNDQIYSGNDSTANTTALSYLKIDLTDYDKDQFIVFDCLADTYSSSSYGYISVSDSLSTTGTQILRLSGNDRRFSMFQKLEKGKVNYVYFGFVKGGGDVNGNESFKVSNFRILGEGSENREIVLYNDVDYYPFVKQEDGSYMNSDTGVSGNTIAHSYAAFDLTNIDEDLELIVNLSITSTSSAARFWMYTSDNSKYIGYDSAPKILGTSGSTSGNYSVKLEKGKLTYLHFGEYNWYSAGLKFVINSMTLVKKSSVDEVETTEFLKNDNDTYTFVKYDYDLVKIKNSASTDISIGTTKLIPNATNNALTFNGSNYAYMTNANFNLDNYEESVYVEFTTPNKGNSFLYMGSSAEKTCIALWSSSIIISNSSHYSTFVMPETIDDGNIHSLLLTYKDDVYKLYYDGIALETTQSSNFANGANANSYIAARSNGNNFTGSIYNFKIFNKELTPEELDNTENLQVYINGEDFKISSADGSYYVSNNQGVSYGVAHTYFKIDLTGITEKKYLWVRTSISSEGADYGYIHVTNSPNTPSNSEGVRFQTSGSNDNQVSIITLNSNEENYIHFRYVKNKWDDGYSDTFTIKEVRLFDNINDAYSFNPDSYTKINNMYFEKPVLNEKVDTIEILRDITLNTPITVPQEKEVVLDLNGFTLTSEKDDYIIKNNGKLTITDSDYEDRQEQNVNYKIEQARLFAEAKTKYFEDVAEYEEYAGLCDGCSPSEEYELDHLITDFSYTGSAQSYTVKETGTYKLQVWGAQGGYRSSSSGGGKGGYSEGLAILQQGETVYVYVGGSGNTGGTAGGFNGGGSKTTYPGGGGATDMRVEGDTLYNRIIVAGGGGSDGSTSYSGKAGGGLTGVSATETSYCSGGEGGTQTSAGTRGSFGQGGSGGYMNAGWGGGGFGGAGGGGWYGGGGVNPDRSDDDRGGGGGSGFVYVGTNEVPEGYAVTSHVLTEAQTIVGTSSEIPSYDGTSTMTGNSGNGYAKITFVLTEEEVARRRSELEKTYNVKEEPRFVDYLDGIDFINSIDINTLTPADDAEYNNVASDVPIGSITTTIYNAILNEEYATLIYERGALNINVNNKTGIVNRGNLSIGEFAEINANNSSTIGVYNETNGNVVGLGGVIKATGSSTIGLLNRSYTPTINGIKVTSSQSNATDVRNDAIADVTYTNLDATGAGTGFTDCSTANVNIVNSNIKSTGNNAYYECNSSLPIRINISSSNLYGTLATDYSASIINVDNSTLTSIYNYLGYVRINNSSLTSINNNGKTIVNSSTLGSSGTIITNNSTRLSGRSGVQHNSSLILRDSIINSTATSATTVINNTNDMIISNVKINNINNVGSTAISNSPGSDSGAYLSVVGNTIIDSDFGTAINNTGTLTLGSSGNNTLQEFEYGYTGHQEEFVAPEDGYYKLETWGASSGRIKDYDYDGFWIRGGFGAYASGIINLHAGDKLYIHVGQAGVFGNQYYGSYNGGGYSRDHVANGFGDPSSGGGATDISLSSEDNHWTYDNGISLSIRSNASYEQRILVAGGGGVCAHSIYYNGYDINYSTCSGGYATSSTQLGYGANSGGGGYYGGTTGSGGSSYVSDTLTNAVMKTGNEEMPDYTSSGLVKGNMGNGFAKISLLSSDNQENVQLSPTISAVNYGITGSGRVIYYDGTITANTSVNSDISDVPEGYDIYNSKDENNIEKMILVANSNSRPVEQGEEEFVAAIGNAKYTTIQNALDASNNGDVIELLVNIEEQNMITIPDTKTITIDYKGHTVKSYNNKYLYKNLGNLTITDSENALNKNVFMGDKYIYNEGILNVSNIYIGSHNYTVNIIQNNEGTVTLDSVKFEFGNSTSSKVAVSNTENGVVTVKDSILNLYNANNMINNLGSLTFKDNTVTGSSSASVVVNEESGTAILDGNAYSVSGNDDNGRYFINNKGTATVKNMTTHVEDLVNTGTLILEDNNIPSGALSSSGIVIINSGSYSNSFSISGAGKSIDATDNLYSFIMHDGTINKTLNRSATGIFNIEKGTITVTSGSAISNSSTGIINLGTNDGTVANKDNTEPKITGKSYGIYTSNPALVVNFYDGIVSGQSAYNVSIEDIETGYSIYREYDDENSIEIKYLTDEPMFTNVTQNINYDSVDDFNDAITNNSVNNNDVIKVYRNITVSKNDNSITIPAGLNITFDLNGKIIDKNNELMFTVNGELTVTNSETTGKVDSTNGNIFENSGTLNISGGEFISERDYKEDSIIINNESATLNISDGKFTKYYDNLKETSQLYRGFGSIINNSGNVNITGGNYLVNSSYRAGYQWGVANYIYTSYVFTNNTTGVINATNMTVDGFPSQDIDPSSKDYTGGTSINGKGVFFTNKGILNISNSTSKTTLIGDNSGTVVMENVSMESIGYINRYYYNNKVRPLVNTGTFTIKGGTYITQEPFKNTGTLIIDEDSSHNGTTIRRNASGITYALVGGEEWTTYLIHNSGAGNIEINKATILADSISTSTAVTNDSSGYIKINNSVLKANDYPGIQNRSSGTIEVYGDSTVESKTSYGIENASSGILSVGQTISTDGAVSQVSPVIKGNTYGVRNSNSGTFNFYDGILEGKTNPVTGVINNIEPGYMIIDGTDGDYKTNYLDKVEIIQNITQATPSDEKKYYDLKTAFEEVNDGDTLQMIANYSNLPEDLTAVNNNNNITLDLNDKFIRQSNSLLLTNNGTLTITDSGQNKTGNIIAVTGSKVIDNYGTLLFNSGKISTSTVRLIIKNNTGATLTVRDEAQIYTSNSSTLVNNEGTVNIYNGAYLRNVSGTGSHFRGTNDGVPMIINKDTLNIIDFNKDDNENTSSSYTAPKLNNAGENLSEFSPWFEFGYYDSIIRNESGATTTIYGGIFNNGSTTSPDYGKMLHNFGTVNIKNLDSYAFLIGYNNGTLNIEDSVFHNFAAGALISPSGTLNIKNTSINFYQKDFVSSFGDNTYAMRIGNATLDNVTMTGGQHTDNGDYPLRLVTITGTSEIKNSSINCIAESYVLSNESTLKITDTPINIDKVLINGGRLTLENSNVTVTNDTGISNSGTLTLDNSNVTVTNGTGISNSGTVNLTSGISVTTTSGNGISTSGTLNVPVGVTITTQNGRGINISGGTTTIGEIGGVPDQTSPYIEGSTYGIYKSDLNAILNFYDGLIVGGSGPNAIYGGVSDVEGGYETEDNIDANDNKHHEYLVVSANSVAVATVGTYTFSANNFISPSRALQNAINFAIGDGTNIRRVTLVTNVDLTNDEFSLTATNPITINLNGNTITSDSTYTIDSNITLNNSFGGNISRILANIMSPETKNIVIYEMSDGSSLDSLKTYKLYKDDKLVSLSKEELGRYSYYGKNEELVPIKGRLYIDNLSKGSYRLVSNDNKYIEFSIDDEGHISGNVVENFTDPNKVNPKSVAKAELVLSHQTGFAKHYYLLAIIPITLVLVMLLIFIRKNKERNI